MHGAAGQALQPHASRTWFEYICTAMIDSGPLENRRSKQINKRGGDGARYSRERSKKIGLDKILLTRSTNKTRTHTRTASYYTRTRFQRSVTFLTFLHTNQMFDFDSQEFCTSSCTSTPSLDPISTWDLGHQFSLDSSPSLEEYSGMSLDGVSCTFESIYQNLSTETTPSNWPAFFEESVVSRDEIYHEHVQMTSLQNHPSFDRSISRSQCHVPLVDTETSRDDPQIIHSLQTKLQDQLCQNQNIQDYRDKSLISDQVTSNSKAVRLSSGCKRKKVEKKRPSLKYKKNVFRQCSHCGVTETTMWRYGGLEGDELMCNPCCLYWKRKHKYRPLKHSGRPIRRRKRPSTRSDDDSSSDTDCLKPTKHQRRVRFGTGNPKDSDSDYVPGHESRLKQMHISTCVSQDIESKEKKSFKEEHVSKINLVLSIPEVHMASQLIKNRINHANTAHGFENYGHEIEQSEIQQYHQMSIPGELAMSELQSDISIFCTQDNVPSPMSLIGSLASALF